jgi:hypothetical protein
MTYDKIGVGGLSRKIFMAKKLSCITVRNYWIPAEVYPALDAGPE